MVWETSIIGRAISGEWSASGTERSERRPSLTEISVEVPFSEDWQTVLKGVCEDMPAANSRMALVTDVVGVLLQPFSIGMLEQDRFPLKVFCPPELPDEKCQQELFECQPLMLSSQASAKTVCNLTQIMAELEYADVWPGTLEAKLWQQRVRTDQRVVNSPCFMMVTDVMGVEVDVFGSKRAPSAERFPLRLHFHAQGLCSPKNIQNRCEGSGPDHGASLSSESVGRRSSRRGVGVREHSVELTLCTVMFDAISSKLYTMGVTLDEANKSLVLLTDCTGVQINPSTGIPDQDRFPLKIHLGNANQEIGDHRVKRSNSLIRLSSRFSRRLAEATSFVRAQTP